MSDLDIHKPISHQTGWTLLLLIFFLLAYILPLGSRGLFVPDETRYAEIPREMIVSGDWVVPHLNGVKYFEKPVLGYWIHAASILLFGKNNFAVRFPSALAVGLSALLIFLLTRRMTRTHDRYGGLESILAPLIFLSCFEVFGVGNTAVLDSLFSFFLTACIIAMYLATEERPGSLNEKGFLLLAGLFCGLSFLTKGFLSFALPILVIVPYLVWNRRYADLIRMSWLPILTALVVILPWSILIHLKEPDFWCFFIWNEHIRRFLADNAQHKESFWFLFLMAPGLFLPWTFAAPAAVTGIKAGLLKQGQHSRLLKFCLCWLLLPFLFFSLSRGKLLTYILPCFPPFAILVALGLMPVLKKNPRNMLFKGGVLAGAVFFGFVLVALMFVQWFGFNGFRPYSHPWKAMMVVNGLVFLTLFCVWSIHNKNAHTKPIFIGFAPLLLFFICHYTIPNLALEVNSPGPFLERYKQDIDGDSIVIADKNSTGAVCWYLGRNDVYLLGGTGELGYGLECKEAEGRSLDTQSASDLIKQNRGKTILIGRVKNAPEWQEQLPQPVFQDRNGPSGYMIWKY